MAPFPILTLAVLQFSLVFLVPAGRLGWVSREMRMVDRNWILIQVNSLFSDFYQLIDSRATVHNHMGSELNFEQSTTRIFISTCDTLPSTMH